MSVANTVHHRYKLNRNCPHKSMGLEGVPLDKNWKSFMYPQALQKHIKNKANPDAIVDYEAYIPATGLIIESSEDLFNKRYPKFTSETLLAMKRDELAKIAKAYGVDSVKKRDEFLARLIMEKQIEVKEQFENLVEDMIVEEDSLTELESEILEEVDQVETPNLAELTMEKQRLETKKRAGRRAKQIKQLQADNS